MTEWGYLLQHLDDGRYRNAARFRRAVIRAEREAAAEMDRIPALVDIALAALICNEPSMAAALIAAGYLPTEEEAS